MISRSEEPENGNGPEDETLTRHVGGWYFSTPLNLKFLCLRGLGLVSISHKLETEMLNDQGT